MNEELEQARARLREIESNLALEIQLAVCGFRMQFGIPISDVSVSMIDVSTIGGKESVVAVKCRAEI